MSAAPLRVPARAIARAAAVARPPDDRRRSPTSSPSRCASISRSRRTAAWTCVTTLPLAARLQAARLLDVRPVLRLVAPRQRARRRGHRARQPAGLGAVPDRRWSSCAASTAFRAPSSSSTSCSAPAPLAASRLADPRWLRERRERPLVRRIEQLALIVRRRLGRHPAARRRSSSAAASKLAVVGFVDDDPAKLGLRVGGTPVLGRIDDLPALVAAARDRRGAGRDPVGARRAPAHDRPALPRRRRALARAPDASASSSRGASCTRRCARCKVDDLLAREPVHLDLPRVARVRRAASGCW